MFGTLTNLTKYFILCSSKVNLVFQGARFERVIKLAGKQLSGTVYEFISYIEESQKQETQKGKGRKKINSDTMKTKVLRETRLIPKVVYEIEQFGKSVIQLSNKTKVDLAKFVGQGTVRDFRIKGLKQVLERNDDTAVTEVQGDDENDASLDDGITTDELEAELKDNVYAPSRPKKCKA